MKRALLSVYYFPRRCLILMIRAYQATFSPDHGLWKHRYPFGYCKFSPTCSAYAAQAIEKKGAVLGTLLAIWRVLRCNPWSKGGKDEVH